MEPTPPTDGIYDPDLHGDLESPPASPVLAFFVAIGAAATLVGGGYAIQQWLSATASTCC